MLVVTAALVVEARLIVRGFVPEELEPQGREMMAGAALIKRPHTVAVVAEARLLLGKTDHLLRAEMAETE